MTQRRLAAGEVEYEPVPVLLARRKQGRIDRERLLKVENDAQVAVRASCIPQSGDGGILGRRQPQLAWRDGAEKIDDHPIGMLELQ